MEIDSIEIIFFRLNHSIRKKIEINASFLFNFRINYSFYHAMFSRGKYYLNNNVPVIGTKSPTHFLYSKAKSKNRNSFRNKNQKCFTYAKLCSPQTYYFFSARVPRLPVCFPFVKWKSKQFRKTRVYFGHKLWFLRERFLRRGFIVRLVKKPHSTGYRAPRTIKMHTM